ncbi:hypothetical protein [Catenuloplanes japonicus]|uniref:hypothetical protein n=1 Tax=Catenuloplanes japonicus TaxID=33876 RepID=UPI00068DB228|nr:hypothetical protein [Catenuloplanes japonicus]
MLTRRTRLRLALATLLAGVLATTGVMLIRGPDVFAAPPNCENTPDNVECGIGGGVGGTNPGNGGGNPGGGGGGGGTCTWKGAEVACYIEGAGSFNANDGCYYRVASPQPTDQPEGLTLYYKSCIDNNLIQVPVDLANPPVLFVPDPAEIALDLFARMVFRTPTIEFAPGTSGVLGMPVWMWISNGAATPPPPESDTQAGLGVSLAATLDRVTWDMGDGHTVVCQGNGKPWTAAAGATRSPDCGYPTAGGDASGYQVASALAGHKDGYLVQATTSFTLHWVATDGQEGDLPGVSPPAGQDLYVVNELQVVNR